MRYILFSVGRDMLEARQQTPQNRRCQLEGEKKNLCYSTTIFDVHMHTRLNQCEKGCFRHHILLLNFYSYPYTHHHSSCFFLSCFLVRLRLTLLLNEVQIDAHFHLLFRVHVSLSYPYNLHVHRCHPCYPCTCVLIALPLPFPTAVVLVGTMPDSTSIITFVAISQSQVESRK